jgi:hypothetical protein
VDLRFGSQRMGGKLRHKLRSFMGLSRRAQTREDKNHQEKMRQCDNRLPFMVVSPAMSGKEA